MSTIPIYSASGSEAGTVEVPEGLFKKARNRQVVHDAITAYRANQRAGTASTKIRSEVRGGGRKPYRQKGTGNARIGSTRSPIRRGGGVTFGPRPRDFSKKLTKKAARAAFRQAVADRIEAGAVRVVDEIAVTEPRTRQVAGLLAAQGLSGKVLVVVDAIDTNLKLASRNLAGVEVTSATDLNVYQVMRYPMILVSKAGWSSLEERLRRQAGSAS